MSPGSTTLTIIGHVAQTSWHPRAPALDFSLSLSIDPRFAAHQSAQPACARRSAPPGCQRRFKSDPLGKIRRPLTGWAPMTMLPATRLARRRPSGRHCRRTCRGATCTMSPESTMCACGCQMQRIGEDVAEKLDYQPGVFTVERHVRGKWVCGHCETLVQAAVPKLPEHRRALLPRSWGTSPAPPLKATGRAALMRCARSWSKSRRTSWAWPASCTCPMWGRPAGCGWSRVLPSELAVATLRTGRDVLCRVTTSHHLDERSSTCPGL